MEVFDANISDSLVTTNLKLQEDLEAEKAENKKISEINDALIANFNTQKREIEKIPDFNLMRLGLRKFHSKACTIRYGPYQNV